MCTGFGSVARGEPRNRGWHPGWIVALLLTTSSATADVAIHGRISGFPGAHPGTSIDLQVERSEQDLADTTGDGAGSLETTRIGLSWYEALNRDTRLGFTLGRQGVDRRDRPGGADQELYGYFGELRFDGAWPLGEGGPWFDLGAALAYGEADGGADEDRTDLDWWSATLRPAVAVTVADRIELRAGLRAQWVDGRERRTDATADFEQDGTLGAFVGAGVRTDPGGRVYLQAQGGPVRGVRVVFERRY